MEKSEGARKVLAIVNRKMSILRLSRGDVLLSFKLGSHLESFETGSKLSQNPQSKSEPAADPYMSPIRNGTAAICPFKS